MRDSYSGDFIPRELEISQDINTTYNMGRFCIKYLRYALIAFVESS